MVAGLTLPLYVCAPPGDTSRIFIAEQHGAIKILDFQTGTVRPTPFLDITDEVGQGQGTGILGMTFDPDYAVNGRFYVSLHDPTGGIFGKGRPHCTLHSQRRSQCRRSRQRSDSPSRRIRSRSRTMSTGSALARARAIAAISTSAAATAAGAKTTTRVTSSLTGTGKAPRLCSEKFSASTSRTTALHHSVGQSLLRLADRKTGNFLLGPAQSFSGQL